MRVAFDGPTVTFSVCHLNHSESLLLDSEVGTVTSVVEKFLGNLKFPYRDYLRFTENAAGKSEKKPKKL